jgi:hypothetical protein
MMGYALFRRPTLQVVPPNAGLQLRRAISIQAEGRKLLEKHAIAPSAARLCYARRKMNFNAKKSNTMPWFYSHYQILARQLSL